MRAYLSVAACRVKGESSGGVIAAKHTAMASVTGVSVDLSWHTQLMRTLLGTPDRRELPTIMGKGAKTRLMQSLLWMATCSVCI